jgi:hypothetical protein
MAFTEKARASNTATMANGVSTTLTLSLLSGAVATAPVAGDWVFVSVYSNRGATGLEWQFASPYSVKCGTVTLQLIEAPATDGVGAFLFGAQYTSGMTSSVTIPVTNASFSTTTVGGCALVFSGAATNATPVAGNYAFRQTTGAGLFDGGGTNTYGSTATAGSAGVITWTNSTALPTNYDTQGEPWVSAVIDTGVPTAVTLQLARSAGAGGVISDLSGNLYQAGGTPGTLPISSTTGVYAPTGGAKGYGVIYGNTGNFTFYYTGVSGSNLTGCVATGITKLAQAGFYAPIMLAGTSAVTITALLNTTSNTVPAINGLITGMGSYTSGTAAANGHVMIGMGGTGTTPARMHLMAGTNANGLLKQTVYGVQRINGTNTATGGGQIYTLVPATRTLTRTSSALQVLTSQAVKVKVQTRLAIATAVRAAKALKAYASNKSAQATHVRSARVSKSANLVRTAKATHVRAARALKAVNLVRLAKAVFVSPAKALKSANLNRQAKATQVVAASITKRVTLTRRASATMNYAISSSKSRTLTRRAIATAVAAGRALQSVLIRTHPGTVEGSFVTASVATKAQTAVVGVSVRSASVSTAFEVGSVEGNFETASVSSKAKFLVKD